MKTEKSLDATDTPRWLSGKSKARLYMQVEMKQSTNKRHIARVLCIVLAIFLFLSGAELLYSAYALTVSRYTVRSGKVGGAIRVAFLSDLHGREFGEDNSRLLSRITSEQPDLIALVGDIFNRNADADEIDRMCTFIWRASEIAPVYFSLGNHEAGCLRNNGSDLLDRVRSCGAIILESDYLDIEINGTSLRIGGYMGYYRQPVMTTDDIAQEERELAFMDAFESADCFKLLLNHIPTGWLEWKGRNKFPVDLVLSGPYHGGQIRIPILEQGLYAPNIGWFPRFTKGLFEGSQATCILTTGLAGSRLPRFFNPPEIAVVDILPAE